MIRAPRDPSGLAVFARSLIHKGTGKGRPRGRRLAPAYEKSGNSESCKWKEMLRSQWAPSGLLGKGVGEAGSCVRAGGALARLTQTGVSHRRGL